MTNVHLFIAYAIPTGFGIMVLTSLFSYFANREAPKWYWSLLGILQGVMALQLIVGLILFIGGARPQSNGPSWLHYVYGAGFPLLVLSIAHVQARKRPGVEILIFGVAAFLCTFSTIRALQTGLGID